VLDSVIAGFLESLTERELDEPLRAVLRDQGFVDIHFVHGPSEFGRDFIAKRTDSGTVRQYAIQSKVGAIDIRSWREIRQQVEDIRTGSLSHPAFDASLDRVAVVVTTGRVIGDARLGMQDYKRTYQAEMDFDVWDGDRLVEYISAAPEAALARRDEGPLLRLLGEIDTGAVDDRTVEEFSRRWFPPAGELVTPASVIEAAVVANRLRRQERLDLSCFVALALLRASAHGAHGREPLEGGEWASGEQATGLFVRYASELFERCDDSQLDPLPFICSHNEFGFFVTYSVRCLRLIEILGLLGLWRRLTEGQDDAEVVAFLDKFIANQPGTAHPLSDCYATSLFAPALLLVGGSSATVAKWLRDTTRWVLDRHDGESLGLGAIEANPEQEVAYLLSAFDHIDVSRRRESYLAAVILDLASVFESDTLYTDARNDFEAVSAYPEILHVPDTTAQYSVDGEGVEQEINPPYAGAWPADGWRTAPHHREDSPLWLERVGHPWHELAIWSVNRDRHSVGLLRRLVARDG
jgi:hypothetical protein